jgi:DNA-binding XRE family transcriptional regulator
MKRKTVAQIHKEWMKDPAYKKAYDDLELEFTLISALIKNRIEKGITQKELAEKIGTKQSSIARFESGHYNPSLAFTQKLARALGARVVIV